MNDYTAVAVVFGATGYVLGFVAFARMIVERYAYNTVYLYHVEAYLYCGAILAPMVAISCLVEWHPIVIAMVAVLGIVVLVHAALHVRYWLANRKVG